MFIITPNEEGCISENPIRCFQARLINECNVKEGDLIEGKGECTIATCGVGRFILEGGFVYASSNLSAVIHYLTWFKHKLLAIHEMITDEDGMDIYEKMLETGYFDTFLNPVLNFIKKYCICELEVPAGEVYWEGDYVQDVCSKRMILRKKQEITRKSELLDLTLKYMSEQGPISEGTKERYMELIEKYKAKGE